VVGVDVVGVVVDAGGINNTLRSVIPHQMSSEPFRPRHAFWSFPEPTLSSPHVSRDHTGASHQSILGQPEGVNNQQPGVVGSGCGGGPEVVSGGVAAVVVVFFGGPDGQVGRRTGHWLQLRGQDCEAEPKPHQFHRRMSLQVQ